MGVLEQQIIKPYLLALPPTSRRFRINSGTGWQGRRLYQLQGLNIPKGMVILADARPLHAAPAGWFDLCGWDTITITPEMVGTEIAVFVGEEIKAKGDRLRPLQKKLGELLRRMGGIWRVIRS